MIQELVFTSAPHGLKPGTSGFCTVASTSGMASNLARLLESLSGYRHIFPATSVDADKNPVAISHLIATVGGKSFSIVSRIAHAGLDYSNRSNKIAHHLVLPHPVRLSGGPAVLLENDDLFFRTWDESPRILPPRSIEGRPVPPAPCTTWKEVTGHAGWGGAPIQAWMEQKPVYLVIRPETPVRALLLESLNLLPDPIRWNVAFSSSLTPLPPGIKCHWRCVLAGSPEERDVRRNPSNLLVDLTRPLPPPTNRYVQEAEQGRQVTSTMPPPPKPGAALADTSAGDALRGSELFEDDSWTESLPLATTLSDEPLRRSGSIESISLAPPSISPGKRRAASHKEPQRFVDPSVPLTNRSRLRRSPARWLPFTVIALLLVITGVLIGVLLTRPSEQPVSQKEDKGSLVTEPAKHSEIPKDDTDDQEYAKPPGLKTPDHTPPPANTGQTDDAPARPNDNPKDNESTGQHDLNSEKTGSNTATGAQRQTQPAPPSIVIPIVRAKLVDVRFVNETTDPLDILNAKEVGIDSFANVSLKLVKPDNLKNIEIEKHEDLMKWSIKQTNGAAADIAHIEVRQDQASNGLWLDVKFPKPVKDILSSCNLIVMIPSADTSECNQVKALIFFQPLDPNFEPFEFNVEKEFNLRDALAIPDDPNGQAFFVMKRKSGGNLWDGKPLFERINQIAESNEIRGTIDIGSDWHINFYFEARLETEKGTLKFGTLNYELVYAGNRKPNKEAKGGEKSISDLLNGFNWESIKSGLESDAKKIITDDVDDRMKDAVEDKKEKEVEKRLDEFKIKLANINFLENVYEVVRSKIESDFFIVTNYPEIFDDQDPWIDENRGPLFVHGFAVVIQNTHERSGNRGRAATGNQHNNINKLTELLKRYRLIENTPTQGSASDGGPIPGTTHE